MKKTLGLALGAGSAKGFAHIGFLQALEKAGIRPDYIAGSSMGAVVGAIYACGTDLDLAAKVVPTLSVREYFDLTIKKSGFIKGKRFQELLKLLTKDREFSQTDIPFACVAVDIDTGKLVEIDSGKLHDGVRGSIAIPGIFEPHPWRGMTLVDGAVISRVPYSTVRRMGAEVVVGVDVGYRGHADGKYEIELKNIRAYTKLCDRITQWELVKLQEKEADLVVAPYVWDLSSNSFEDAAEIIARGKQAGEEALPRIRQLLE